MKILHITPETNGYEEVVLLANAINKINHLAAIEKNGEQFMTGGFLINDTPEIREVLDKIPKDQQYEFVKKFKINPFLKLYLENDWQDLKTHPKNTELVEGLKGNGEVIKCHYACDFSGEEQPPFEGFFKDCGGFFAQVTIVKWRPINAD